MIQMDEPWKHTNREVRYQRPLNYMVSINSKYQKQTNPWEKDSKNSDCLRLKGYREKLLIMHSFILRVMKQNQVVVRAAQHS